MFSVQNSLTLTAYINIEVQSVYFNWYCVEAETGSPCFTTSYVYFSLSNEQNVTIQKSSFFPNKEY
jgi:hypothetical protein